MSITKHKLETKYFKQCMHAYSKEAWQKYLDVIDKEIDFLKEWERSIEERNKNK